jgi:CII-binding regulator of phage lambda lysogenization HflD
MGHYDSCYDDTPFVKPLSEQNYAQLCQLQSHVQQLDQRLKKSDKIINNLTSQITTIETRLPPIERSTLSRSKTC